VIVRPEAEGVSDISEFHSRGERQARCAGDRTLWLDIDSLRSAFTPSLLQPIGRTEKPETAGCTEFVVAQFSHFAYS
jgi:hypothetical protein